MHLYGALVMFLTLSTVCGLRCYTCMAADPRSCTDTKACSVFFNQCYTIRVEGLKVVTKGCQNSVACVSPFECCEGNLCNSANPASSSLLLLLVSSAIATLFL